MKTYKVKINGKKYTVELESIEENVESIKSDSKDKKVPIKKEETVKKINDENALDVLSPIQGNIINVLVKKGQKVKKGDVLVIIEAMKLENEVNAPNDGEIVEVYVEKGQSVATNQLLVKIK